MYQWLHLWLLWFDSSFVVYRFGVPLFRLKFSMGFNMSVSWHLGRRKAERCRWVSDMWATTGRLIDSEFRKLGAYPIRRHISTVESAPNFCISDTLHYTLFTENTPGICLLLTNWERNQPQPPRRNHKVNTNKTQNQWQNGWKLIELKKKTDLAAAHTQSQVVSWETSTSHFSKSQASWTYHWFPHSQSWTSYSNTH